MYFLFPLRFHNMHQLYKGSRNSAKKRNLINFTSAGMLQTKIDKKPFGFSLCICTTDLVLLTVGRSHYLLLKR